MLSPVDTLKQPAYTGENRCTPCTVVNVCIGAGLALAVGWFVPLAGVAVFLTSLLAIYLRGYLVPGTPTLTKRYVPERVLALFDKAPEADASGQFDPAADRVPRQDVDAPTRTDGADDSDAADPAVVPEQLLADLGVVEPCESGDDLCLTDSFERAWLDATERHRDDVTDPALLAPLFDVDAEQIEVSLGEQSVVVGATAVGRQRWLSTGALLADATANELLLGDHDRWAALAPERRLPICKALRSFLPTCPLCGGEIEMGEETVESCCRSWAVIAVACTECEERYLEVDAETIESAVEP